MSFTTYPAYNDSGVEWLAKIPEQWQTIPFKYVADFVNGMAFKPEQWRESGIPIIRIENLNNGESFNCYEGQVDSRYHVNTGDLLFGWSGNRGTSFGPFLWQGKGLHYLNQHIFRIADFKCDKKWLYWTLRAVTKAIEDQAHGIIGMVHVTKGKLGAIKIPSIPRYEQTQIARFLDHETARIDALIEEQQSLIELLKEKRRAVISHAVTKGLDPSIPMKESGVEWLGKVPAHWEVKQLKHLVDPNTSITYGIVQAGPEFEGGIPYIRTSDMSGEELPASGYPLTSPDIDESYARSRVRPGDIVMSIRASVGKCLPVPDELKIANLTQGTAKISAGKHITRNFLLAFLNAEASQNYFDLMAKGATFKEITLDALRRTPVLLPPANEQNNIDLFVARHAGLLDEIGKQAVEGISLLKERRCALISAAVTGKIDVRGWQPPVNAPSPELAQEAV